MRHNPFIILFLILTLLTGETGCKKKSTEPEEPSFHMEYAGLTNNGCLGLDTPARVPNRNPYLVNHIIQDDLLTLTIHYEANCCPAFIDSIRLMDQTVEILIKDTLNGCRCLCDYENGFAFIYSGSGTLHLLFGWFEEPFSLDTTIVLP